MNQKSRFEKYQNDAYYEQEQQKNQNILQKYLLQGNLNQILNGNLIFDCKNHELKYQRKINIQFIDINGFSLWNIIAYYLIRIIQNLSYDQREISDLIYFIIMFLTIICMETSYIIFSKNRTKNQQQVICFVISCLLYLNVQIWQKNYLKDTQFSAESTYYKTMYENLDNLLIQYQIIFLMLYWMKWFWKCSIVIIVTILQSVLLFEDRYSQSLGIILMIIQIISFYISEYRNRDNFIRQIQKYRNLKQLVEIMNTKLPCGVVIFQKKKKPVSQQIEQENNKSLFQQNSIKKSAIKKIQIDSDTKILKQSMQQSKLQQGNEKNAQLQVDSSIVEDQDQLNVDIRFINHTLFQQIANSNSNNLMKQKFIKLGVDDHNKQTLQQTNNKYQKTNNKHEQTNNNNTTTKSISSNQLKSKNNFNNPKSNKYALINENSVDQNILFSTENQQAQNHNANHNFSQKQKKSTYFNLRDIETIQNIHHFLELLQVPQRNNINSNIYKSDDGQMPKIKCNNVPIEDIDDSIDFYTNFAEIKNQSMSRQSTSKTNFKQLISNFFKFNEKDQYSSNDNYTSFDKVYFNCQQIIERTRDRKETKADASTRIGTDENQKQYDIKVTSVLLNGEPALILMINDSTDRFIMQQMKVNIDNLLIILQYLHKTSPSNNFQITILSKKFYKIILQRGQNLKNKINILLFQQQINILTKQYLIYQESSEFKSQLLNYIQHIAKTPLNSIIQLSETMEQWFPVQPNNKQICHDIQDNLDIIKKNGLILHHQVQSIIDLQQINCNSKISLKTDIVDLYTVVKEVQDLFQTEIDAKNLKFEIIVDEESVEMRTDENRLVQIFIEMIGNSVKFTRENDSIKIEIHLQKTYAVNLISIQIIDTGTGMPTEQVALINSSGNLENMVVKNTQFRQGPGIGLEVSRKLIGLLGPFSKFNLKSTVGEGSSFKFWLYQNLNEKEFAEKSNKMMRKTSEIILDKSQGNQYDKFVISNRLQHMEIMVDPFSLHPNMIYSNKDLNYYVATKRSSKFSATSSYSPKHARTTECGYLQTSNYQLSHLQNQFLIEQQILQAQIMKKRSLYRVNSPNILIRKRDMTINTYLQDQGKSQLIKYLKQNPIDFKQNQDENNNIFLNELQSKQQQTNISLPSENLDNFLTPFRQFGKKHTFSVRNSQQNSQFKRSNRRFLSNSYQITVGGSHSNLLLSPMKKKFSAQQLSSQNLNQKNQKDTQQSKNFTSYFNQSPEGNFNEKSTKQFPPKSSISKELTKYRRILSSEETYTQSVRINDLIKGNKNKEQYNNNKEDVQEREDVLNEEEDQESESTEKNSVSNSDQQTSNQIINFKYNDKQLQTISSPVLGIQYKSSEQEEQLSKLNFNSHQNSIINSQTCFNEVDEFSNQFNQIRNLHYRSNFQMFSPERDQIDEKELTIGNSFASMTKKQERSQFTFNTMRQSQQNASKISLKEFNPIVDSIEKQSIASLHSSKFVNKSNDKSQNQSLTNFGQQSQSNPTNQIQSPSQMKKIDKILESQYSMKQLSNSKDSQQIQKAVALQNQLFKITLDDQKQKALQQTDLINKIKVDTPALTKSQTPQSAVSFKIPQELSPQKSITKEVKLLQVDKNRDNFQRTITTDEDKKEDEKDSLNVRIKNKKYSYNGYLNCKDISSTGKIESLNNIVNGRTQKQDENRDDMVNLSKSKKKVIKKSTYENQLNNIINRLSVFESEHALDVDNTHFLHNLNGNQNIHDHSHIIADLENDDESHEEKYDISNKRNFLQNKLGFDNQEFQSSQFLDEKMVTNNCTHQQPKSQLNNYQVNASRSSLGNRQVRATLNTIMSHDFDQDIFDTLFPQNTLLLIVDDTTFNRIVLKQMFKSSQNLIIHEAINGQDALDKIKTLKETTNRSYNLIFMDLNMPIMDGFEALKQIHGLIKQNYISWLPIVAVTAYDTEVENCRKSGFDGFIAKPIRIKEMVRTLIRIISLRKVEDQQF